MRIFSITKIFGINKVKFVNALKSFRGLPHRQEVFLKKGNINRPIRKIVKKMTKKKFIIILLTKSNLSTILVNIVKIISELNKV